MTALSRARCAPCLFSVHAVHLREPDERRVPPVPGQFPIRLRRDAVRVQPRLQRRRPRPLLRCVAGARSFCGGSCRWWPLTRRVGGRGCRRARPNLPQNARPGTSSRSLGRRCAWVRPGPTVRAAPAVRVHGGPLTKLDGALNDDAARCRGGRVLLRVRSQLDALHVHLD